MNLFNSLTNLKKVAGETIAGGNMSINVELDLDRPMKDIRHEAVLNIVRTANILALKGAALFRDHDLTEAQFNVLFALKYKTVVIAYGADNIKGCPLPL